MSDLVRLVHPDLPGREVETTARQAVPLRKVGWEDAPPRPAKPPKKSTTMPAPPSDTKES